jgi:hypothetical protein
MQGTYLMPKLRNSHYVLMFGRLGQRVHNTLTHTPSPMKFLNKILERPDTEKPLMILVAGYAARHVRVPDITRKSLEQISSYHE